MTRRLEVAESSGRVKILQDYANAMVEGTSWKGKIRVVIMNKGKSTRDAFVIPDGTIFIDQSLINIFESLDEVVAVVAREVGHLINNGWKEEWVSRIRRGISFGVGWLHEGASDVGTASLLEKVDLDPSAFSRVGKRMAEIFGNRRGLEHQAPYMRSAEVEAVHLFEDYEGSEKISPLWRICLSVRLSQLTWRLQKSLKSRGV